MGNNGYSYKITITNEELSIGSTLAGGSIKAANKLQPPIIAANRSPTNYVSMTIGRFSSYAFNKIVEPRFDGMGAYTGVPINNPDFISEHHFIGLMRCTESALAPHYKALIEGTTGSTGGKG